MAKGEINSANGEVLRLAVFIRYGDCLVAEQTTTYESRVAVAARCSRMAWATVPSTGELLGR